LEARKSAFGGFFTTVSVHPLNVVERVDTIKSNPIK
jgi:hypothetical protein